MSRSAAIRLASASRARVGFRVVRRLVLLLTFFASADLASGLDVTQWTNTTGVPDPFYQDASNWDNGLPLGAVNQASFELDATYEVWWDAGTGAVTPMNPSDFRLLVNAGNVTFLNKDAGPQYEYETNIFAITGATTSFTNRGLNLSVSGLFSVDAGMLTFDGSHPAGARVETGSLLVNGTAKVIAGGVVESGFGTVGFDKTSIATVTGAGSQWNNSNTVRVGNASAGTLVVEAAGVVSGVDGIVGDEAAGIGAATVTGVGSQWNSSAGLTVGNAGAGTLNVRAGGVVSNTDGILGSGAGSIGAATVTDAGSQWNNSGDLTVGAAGIATLTIADDGLVVVGGSTTVGAGSALHFDGGNLQSTGTLTNSGSLFGDASLATPLVNQAGGRIEVVGGERLRFTGASNSNAGQINSLAGTVEFESPLTNSGEINNSGGNVRFGQGLTNQSGGELNNFDGGNFLVGQAIDNQAGGFIGGSGQFIADSWTNEGVLAFSAAPTNVLGDVANNAGGQIVTTGFAVTTFFDDVVHNGAEIRTAQGSGTVILGAASGAGAYTGTGTVFFEGDLRPANSPGIVTFAGNVAFGSLLDTEIELSGINRGDFDRLEIVGDLFLAGELFVDLIDGFELSQNQEFIIADVGGALSGQFDGLGEGALVGNFGGQDLFITYAAGAGNDVALFTPVPEPGTFVLLAVGIAALAAWRRKRRPV